jgi:asparagine synthetase B (glutamine-hydrolysing)
MCGIFFSIARNGPVLPDQHTVDALHARGPDSYKVLNVTCSTDNAQKIYLTFISSVLALRGERIQRQPLFDEASGSVFCWNGEAWKVGGDKVTGNDSVHVWDLLLQATSPQQESDRHQRISEVLTSIAGPFAFVFYDAPTSTVYYGRDRLGRRSLLVNQCDDGSSLTLSSISPLRQNTGCCSEVATDTIHYLRLKSANNVVPGKLPCLNVPLAINKSLPPNGSPPAVPSASSIEAFLQHLRDALILRSVDIPDHFHGQMQPGSAKVAILFSGGLDCTLLARLLHDLLPREEAVDLLNVAFENPRSMAAKGGGTTGAAYELCPDRITGRSSFSELCQICPERRWRFVAINVPYTEALSHKPSIINLMYPHNTEMDLSIAMALHFAARGKGEVSEHPSDVCSKAKSFVSTARVLLSGLGADELYAGYSRHAAAFSRDGFRGLADELELDFDRIGSRNLGRDDRVMSHWGKEIRYPYLDEDFVRFSLSLPVWEKSGFRPGKSVPKHYEAVGTPSKSEDLEPAKMLLRLAMWQLGMRRTAAERKRAIQFGARTAKMDVGKGRTKGTDILTLSAG